ncbi:MAG TPA: PAS domain S-box protein, partial [Chthoniobacteraceae bacterium]|nr:PAS domain S-box protein [Chthoniobacteraceae bacterium]
IVALVTGYATVNTVKQRLIASTGELLALAASDIADKLDMFFFERINDLKTLRSTVLLSGQDAEGLNRHLTTLQSNYNVYEWIAVTDSSGRIVSSTDQSDLLSDQRETAWFRAASQSTSRVYVQEVAAPGNGLGGRAILFATAMRDESDKVTGAVVTRTGLPTTDLLFENTSKAFQSLSATHSRLVWRIVARDGRVLHDSRATSSKDSFGDRPPGDRAGWSEEKDIARRTPIIRGDAPIRGRADFAGFGWGVIVEIDRADALAAMHRVLWQVLFVGSAIVLPLLGLLIWSVRQLRRDWVRLGASESHLATTLHSIAEGVILTDTNGRITLLNDAAEVLTGWREADAKGKAVRYVVRLMDRETRKPLELPMAKNGVRESAAALLLSRDGTERIVNQSASPIPENGGVAGMALICRDVTERELADAAFRASQKTFRLITENMSDVVTLHDLEGRAVFQSHNRYSQLVLPAVSPEDGPLNYIIEEDQSTVRDSLNRLLTTGEPQRTEYRVRQPDQRVVFVESINTLVRRPDGEPEKIVAVSRDVTSRRETERRLIAEKEFSDTLLASLPGIFFMCNEQRRLLRWNRNFEIVTGYASEELAELDLPVFFPLQEQDHVEECLHLCLRSGKADIETTVWHRNGRLTAHYISALRCDINRELAMLCIGIDVSGRKAAEEALVTT